MVEKHNKQHFIENKLSLAVVGGHHRRLCSSKSSTFTHLGSEPALQSIRMILFTVFDYEVFDYEVFEDHELLKHKRSPSVLSGLVLRDRSVLAVFRRWSSTARVLTQAMMSRSSRLV